MTAPDEPTAPDPEHVRLALDGSIATVTIDRPRIRNAMGRAEWAALRAHLDSALARGARALIVTGADGSFCAGADTSAAQRADLHPLDRMDAVTEPLIRLQELPIPVIAKVDGPAVGAGLSLALCADLVVASPRARFGAVFARRGLSLDTGCSWLLPRAVGLHTAKRLAYLAEVIDADEAYRIGLVTWLRPHDEIDGFTDRLARRLAEAAPVALRLDKELLSRAHERSFREAVAAENHAQAVNIGTDAPTAREAASAGEPPVFTGRWRG